MLSKPILESNARKANTGFLLQNCFFCFCILRFFRLKVAYLDISADKTSITIPNMVEGLIAVLFFQQKIIQFKTDNFRSSQIYVI